MHNVARKRDLKKDEQKKKKVISLNTNADIETDIIYIGDEKITCIEAEKEAENDSDFMTPPRIKQKVK